MNVNREINIHLKHVRILSEPGGRNGNQSNAQIAEPKTERGARGFKSLSAKPIEMRPAVGWMVIMSGQICVFISERKK